MPLQRDPRTGRLVVVPMDQPAAAPPAQRPSRLAEMLKAAEAQAPPAPEKSSSWGDWGATALRGAAGFVPGGPWGAVAGGGAELFAQLLEGRDDMNWTQVGAQAGLGFIPFGGKAKSLVQAGIKGAGHGALGAGITESAETGELPSADTLVRGATIGGGAGAGVSALAKFLKGGPRTAAPDVEIGPHVPNKSGYTPGSGFGDAADAVPTPVERYSPNRSGYVPPPRNQATAVQPSARPAAAASPFTKPRAPGRVVAEAVDAGEPVLHSRALGRYMRSFEKGNESLTDEFSDATERAQAHTLHKDLNQMDMDYRRLIDDPRGEINPDLLFSLGSGTLGAAAGAAGAEDGERLQAGLLGGAAGAAAPTLLQRLGKMGQRSGGAAAESTPVDASGRPLGGYTGPERRSTARTGDVTGDDALYERMRSKLASGEQTGSRANRELGQKKSLLESFREQAGKARGEVPLPRTSAGMLANEAGSVSNDLNFNILSAVLGSGAGAYLDPENRGRGAVAGGILGAAAPRLIGNPTLERGRFAAMLSSPLTHLRNTVGVAGSTAIGGIEKAIEQGDPSVAVKTLKELFSPETIEAGKRAFNDPSTTSKVSGPGIATEGALSIPGRLLGAEDAAGRSALQRAGFSADDAERRMFAGDPHSETGKALLQFQRKNALTRFLLPFARTQTNILEQGIERMDPRGLADPAKRRMTAAMLGLSGAAGGAGYLAGDEAPISTPILAAAAGPYALPFALGSAAGALSSDSDDPNKVLNAVAAKAQQQIPLVQDYALNPGRVLSSYVPNLLRDVNPDEWQRDTTGTVFGPAFAKIPFLSETLPKKKRKRSK